MKNFILNSKRGLALVAVGFTLTGSAFADEVRLTGSSLGQFNLQPYASTNTILDLVYNNSTFDNTTVGNMLDLGGAPNPVSNFNNLGSFSLGMTNGNYNGNTFTLQITFTSPTVIVGGSTTVFNDIITGTVLNGDGGVFIDFDNTPHVFSFANATAVGSFAMFVNDVSIAPGQVASLTGHITGSQQAVPEPITFVGLGIAAVGLMHKRRKV